MITVRCRENRPAGSGREGTVADPAMTCRPSKLPKAATRTGDLPRSGRQIVWLSGGQVAARCRGVLVQHAHLVGASFLASELLCQHEPVP